MMTTEKKPEIAVIPATREDVPVLLKLIMELSDYEKLTHLVSANEENVAHSLFDLKAAEALLLTVDGVPVGHCIFFHNFSTFTGKPGIYLEDLYVSPDYRRQGLGRAAFAYLGRLAKERDCTRLEFCVLDWNEPAQKFYESLGAEMLNEWKVMRFAGEPLARLAEL